MRWLETFQKIEAAHDAIYNEDFGYAVVIFPDRSWAIMDERYEPVWSWPTVDDLDAQLRRWAEKCFGIEVW